jgi:hypothetical protein
MRQKVRLGVATFILAGLMAACGSSDTTTARPITYGAAKITPSPVKVGFAFVFRPAKTVALVCAYSATVFEAVEGMPKLLQLNLDGHTARFDGTGPEPTWLACGAAPSDRPVVYHTNDDFPIGTFVLCVTWDPTPDGCATFSTVKA